MVVLWRDLAAHGEQMQVPVHDQKGPDHAPERGRSQRDPVRKLPVSARLGLARVVQDILPRGQERELAETCRAQVDQVQDLPQVLLGTQVLSQAVEERGPLQQDVGDRVFELSPRHVLHGLVHDGHALVCGVALGPTLLPPHQILVPAHHQAQQLVPVQEDVHVVRLLGVGSPHPGMHHLSGDLARRCQLQVQGAQLHREGHLSLSLLLGRFGFKYDKSPVY